ncbi:alpha/beta hydrolase family protein [Streptomyces sp. SID11385]|uniref:alpha/beta hydrolase n=1 Tax=Streptomyces sp. SID11385 TaxID=2706031 RepID=UPI0013C6C7D8|nr:alpha/beta hydrolase family protein [Streptomyces sp. SID11385]NEA40540.1 alpha/beta hydrolase [Streptomyces sp. SID11385]
MAAPRERLTLDVGGVKLTALVARPEAVPEGGPKPLIVALHGGTYTADYFSVEGGSAGSFLDVAAAHGHVVFAFDRPGYGGSAVFPPAENTFTRHAEVLTSAVEAVAEQEGATQVLLVGHSIGGMIALMIAARAPRLPLVGVSATGMGAVIPPGGAAEALAELPADATVDLPYDQRDQVMFGPAGTFREEAVRQAHGSYAPTPAMELIQAPAWPREHLGAVAPEVRVPVQNVLAEYDALWDSAPENVARFASLFTAAPFVDASVARGTGHCLDHHLLGYALHLRQLAFAEECAALDGRR